MLIKHLLLLRPMLQSESGRMKKSLMLNPQLYNKLK